MSDPLALAAARHASENQMMPNRCGCANAKRMPQPRLLGIMNSMGLAADWGRVTGYPEVIPSQKAGCRNSRLHSPLTCVALPDKSIFRTESRFSVALAALVRKFIFAKRIRYAVALQSLTPPEPVRQ